jgi:hypothetical protein
MDRQRHLPDTPDPEIGGSKSDNFKSLFRPGSKVPVRFNPSNPGRSALLIPPPTWVRREFVMEAFGLIAALSIGWHLINILRSPESEGVDSGKDD